MNSSFISILPFCCFFHISHMHSFQRAETYAACFCNSELIKCSDYLSIHYRHVQLSSSVSLIFFYEPNYDVHVFSEFNAVQMFRTTTPTCACHCPCLLRSREVEIQTINVQVLYIAVQKSERRCLIGTMFSCTILLYNNMWCNTFSNPRWYGQKVQLREYGYTF